MSKDGEHSSEQGLIESRRAKAQRLRARGENPFANDTLRTKSPTLDIRALRERGKAAVDAAGKYDTDKVDAAARGEAFHIRGRVIAFRRH